MRNHHPRRGWARSPWLRLALVPLAGSLLLPGLFSGHHGAASAATAQDSGILCNGDTTQSRSTAMTQSFVLTAEDGHITAPDGNSLYMWGFGLGKGDFTYPGPTICVKAGDTVKIVLKNTLAEDVSIVFPGIEGVKANGILAGPQFDAGGHITSLTNDAGANGGSVTYTFKATSPGTYLYESGTDQAKQVQMGLFGALVVRPASHSDWAYDDARTAFDPKTEFVAMLSDIDVDLHAAVERGQPFDIRSFHADYWMINGRSFPDTIAPNNAVWLPHQPQGALWHTVAVRYGTNPASVPGALVRYLSVSEVAHPFHPHGNHGVVIARDGRPLMDANGNYSFEKYAINVAPGQTTDAIYQWTDVDNWEQAGGAGAAPSIPSVPALENLLFKDNATYYSGSPWLGQKGSLPAAVTSFNQCGEFYQVAHSHALNEVTNYGVAMGGMLTLWRIDPPAPNTCG